MRCKDPGYIYILAGKDGAFKIGRTNNIDRRMAQIKPAMPYKPRLICAFYVDDCQCAEQELHIMYGAKRLNGEWFHLDRKDIEEIAKSLAIGALCYEDSLDTFGAVLWPEVVEYQNGV